MDARIRERFGDAAETCITRWTGPEQVDHRGRGERRGRSEAEPADRPDVLLELRCRGALDRPVAGVVDAWRQLVDDQRAVAEEEELGGEGAAQVHRLGEGRPDLDGASGDIGGHRSRRHRFDEDPLVMGVPGDREDRHGAVETARDDDGQLGGEVELALGEERGTRRPAETLPGIVELRGRRDPELSAAVVSADRQLEPERQTELGGGGTCVRHGSDLAPRGHSHAGPLDEPALGEAVLGDDQRPVPGSDRRRGPRSPRRHRPPRVPARR